MQIEFLIAYFSFGSVAIPMSIALLHWKKMENALKQLSLVLILSLFSDLISLLLIQYSLNTYLVGNIYLIAQFFLIALIFRSQLAAKRAIDFVLFLFVLFYGVNILFFQGPWIFNSISNVVASLFLIGICVTYFYRLLNDLPIIHIQQLPMLWVTFGVLTYYSGNFFLFLVNNYLEYDSHGPHKLVWILHNLLNISKNILFAIALWQSYRKVKLYTLSSSAP